MAVHVSTAKQGVETAYLESKQLLPFGFAEQSGAGWFSG